jgi:hypothetical protein
MTCRAERKKSKSWRRQLLRHWLPLLASLMSSVGPLLEALLPTQLPLCVKCAGRSFSRRLRFVDFYQRHNDIARITAITHVAIDFAMPFQRFHDWH